MLFELFRIIIALLTVVERIGDIFISWLPMYGEIKLAFFIYLWYPKTKGTGYIYEVLLRPFVSKHETDIDRKLLELRARAWDFAIYYWQNCTKLGQSTFFQILEYLAAQSGKFSSTNSKKAEKYEPRSPPAPSSPSLHEAPSMSKHKWPSRAPPPPGTTINRSEVSESPKSTRVELHLDEQIEYINTVDPATNTASEPDVNDKLHQARMRLRRSKPIQN
ncbi:Receptor expression-enhancing protein, putative [Ricinus communis]|uniref:HVA22-like protein n=1 Tax=Ricinus communis TaxID=3988 RepID=B9SVY7_RICCO|nr:Receptor expression-enhancing protein, putative [Ricinus communis]